MSRSEPQRDAKTKQMISFQTPNPEKLYKCYPVTKTIRNIAWNVLSKCFQVPAPVVWNSFKRHIDCLLGGVTCPNATCLIRYKLCCVFRRVKDHHKFAIISVCLKKTCVRQVVLDKRFPLNAVALPACLYLASSLRRRACGRPDILQYNSIHLYIYIYMS